MVEQAQYDPPPGHAQHFAQRLPLLGDEAQRGDACRPVETAVGKRQPLGTTLHEAFAGPRQKACIGEPLKIGIDARRLQPRFASKAAREVAGAAADVEQGFAALRPEQANEQAEFGIADPCAAWRPVPGVVLLLVHAPATACTGARPVPFTGMFVDRQPCR